MTETAKGHAELVERLREGDIGYARVRVDTSPDADGWCFFTPAAHPNDVERKLLEEFPDEYQSFGQVFPSTPIAAHGAGAVTEVDGWRCFTAPRCPARQRLPGEGWCQRWKSRAESADAEVARLTHALETATTFSAEIKGALETRIEELTGEVARLKDENKELVASLTETLAVAVRNETGAFADRARSLIATKGG